MGGRHAQAGLVREPALLAHEAGAATPNPIRASQHVVVMLCRGTRKRVPLFGDRRNLVIFTETELRGAFVVDLDRREDSRGFFARTFCQHEFEEHGLKPVIAQANIAFNRRKGTRAAGCISSSRLPRRRSSCAARVARSSTSSSTSALKARHVSRARRCRTDGRQSTSAVRTGAVRPRISGAGGQHRDQLPGRRVLHSRSRRRSPVTTTRGSASSGRCQ